MTDAGEVRGRGHRLSVWLVGNLALLLLRLLHATWRYRRHGWEHFEEARRRGPVVGAFLHGHTFQLVTLISRPQHGRWLVMCSKSKDGDYMSHVHRGLGLEVVRGSSGRDGLQAIVDMVRVLQQDRGLSSCLAVDGSRGPRGSVHPGVLSVAQHTGATILPVAASARPAHIFLKSWDLMMLPWPFARIELVIGEPMTAPTSRKARDKQAFCQELEGRLRDLEAEAHRRTGRSAEFEAALAQARPHRDSRSPAGDSPAT